MKHSHPIISAVLLVTLVLPFGSSFALAAGENLVPNPSVESVSGADPTLPEGWFKGNYGTNVATFSYPVLGASSTSAVEVSLSSRTNGDAKWYSEEIPVTPGTEYQVGDMYKATVPTTFKLKVLFTSGAVEYVTLRAGIASASEWTPLSYTFTVPVGAQSVSLLHFISRVGTLTTDGYFMNALGVVTPPPIPTSNLIVNGSFEIESASMLSSWKQGMWGVNSPLYTYPIVGRDGAKAVKLEVTSYTDGDAKWYPADVLLESGKSYAYESWYRSDTTSDVVARYTMENGGEVYVQLLAAIPPSASWARMNTTITPPTAAKSMTLFHLLRGIGVLDMDDVSLVIATATPPTVDARSPLVEITSPAQNAIVSGTVSILASSTDDVGVSNVQFTLDAVPLGGPITLPPYTTAWDTSTTLDGVHTLVATSYDGAGNNTQATRTVTVSNNIATTTSTGGNLIANAGMEVGGIDAPLGWLSAFWGTNTATFTYPVMGRSGLAASQVSMTSYSSGDAKWFFTPVAVESGVPYVFSNFYMSDVPTGGTARFTLIDGSFIYADLGFIPASATWKQFTANITPPVGAVAVTVFHSIQSVGTLTVDDYSLRLASTTETTLFDRGMVSLSFDDGWLSHYTLAAPMLSAAGLRGSFAIISLETLDALPYNRIANPSFLSVAQSGDPVDWTRGGYGTNDAVLTYPVIGLLDTTAARVTIANYSDGDAKWVFKDATVVDGARYSISDNYRSSATTTITARYNMGSSTYVYVDLLTLPPSPVWTTFTHFFTMPGDVESFTFFHSLRSIGILEIDEMNFSKEQLFVSPAQVLAMQSAGNEIMSHTQSHVSLPNVPLAQMTAEVVGSKSDLLSMGATPVNVLAYPYGDYSQSVIGTMQSAGYIGGRSVDPGYNDKTTNPYGLKIQQIQSTTTVGEVRGWIDAATIEKKWLILMFHQVDNSGLQLSVTPTNFQSILDYLRTSSTSVVTLAEGLGLME